VVFPQLTFRMNQQLFPKLFGLIFLTIWGLAPEIALGQTDLGARPPLVVGITVDQMRADYLVRYWDDFGEGGFKRMVGEGFVCADHHFGYAPTYTGPGHASIFTGTTPQFHGIIGNNWYERSSGKSVYCAGDSNVYGVGPVDPAYYAGQMSPHRLRTSTLGDELKFALGMQPKVIGISLKDRGAILPAGHAADAAYWFHGKDVGGFISSTHYMNELPNWVEKWNKKTPATDYLDKGWSLLRDENVYDESWADNNPYESPFRGSLRPAFPYDLASLSEQNGGFDILKSTPWGNTIVVDFALAAVENEALGADATTDLLAISFSATDYVGHQFGVHAMETQDTYLRLDAELKRLFDALDEQVGEGNWLAWLTADHGAATVPSLAKSEKLPTGYWKPGALEETIEEALGQDWVLSVSNDQIFLDRPAILASNQSLEAVQNQVAEIAAQHPDVDRAVTATELQRYGGYDNDVLSRLAWGHHAKASGDVILLPAPGWLDYGPSGTSHGSPYAYDTHVPCLFLGWGIAPGITYERTHIRDIAPTVAALIHSPLPNGCTGRPIEDLFD
jgi:predicted AlkP superfamily pyrophosphatase or phosphodiesterase